MVKGASKGSLLGAAASVATGAAILVTAPAWVPFIGGTVAVSAATVATWAAVGTAVGAITGGTKEVVKQRRIDKEFKREGFNI